MVDAMYKMILKQLWNERKGNLFIWLEMLVVSIFLWYAADALFVMYRLYSQPLGFMTRPPGIASGEAGIT